MAGDATCRYFCQSYARTWLATRSQDISFGRYRERFVLQLNLDHVLQGCKDETEKTG